MLKRWRVGLLGLFISLVAVYFILSKIDFTLFGEALQEARWGFLVPTVIFIAAGLVSRAFRWRLLLSQGLPFNRTFNIMNVAYLINGVIPFRIGEVARIFLATRADPPVPMFKTAGTIVVERLLDLLAVVMLIAFALFAGPVPGVLKSAGLVVGVGGLGAFLVLVVFSRQRELSHRIAGWFVDRLPFLKRFDPVAVLDHFLDGLLPLASFPTLFGALGWTAVSWLFSIAASYMMMYIFYTEASLVATCLFIAAASLAVAVPATVGSLGVYEASILFALEAVGYGEPYATAVAFAVTVHLINTGVNSTFGMFGFVAEGVTLEQLSTGVKNVQQAYQPDSAQEVTPTEMSSS